MEPDAPRFTGKIFTLQGDQTRLNFFHLPEKRGASGSIFTGKFFTLQGDQTPLNFFHFPWKNGARSPKLLLLICECAIEKLFLKSFSSLNFDEKKV